MYLEYINQNCILCLGLLYLKRYFAIFDRVFAFCVHNSVCHLTETELYRSVQLIY